MLHLVSGINSLLFSDILVPVSPSRTATSALSVNSSCTLMIHNSFTFSLLAQNLPLHRSFPPCDHRPTLSLRTDLTDSWLFLLSISGFLVLCGRLSWFLQAFGHTLGLISHYHSFIHSWGVGNKAGMAQRYAMHCSLNPIRSFLRNPHYEKIPASVCVIYSVLGR